MMQSGVFGLIFENGETEFALIYAHHSHDDKTCCACGDRWPCAPAEFLAEQVQAHLNEHIRGRTFRIPGPEFKRLTDMIDQIVGTRYSLFVLELGWVK